MGFLKKEEKKQPKKSHWFPERLKIEPKQSH